MPLEPLEESSSVWSHLRGKPFETCARHLFRACPRDRSACEAGPKDDALLSDLPEGDGCVATERSAAPDKIDCWDAEALLKAWETAGVATPDNPAAPGSWRGVEGCALENQRSRVQWQETPRRRAAAATVPGSAPMSLARFHEEMQAALAGGINEYERWLRSRHETVLSLAPLSQQTAKALVDLVNERYVRLRGEQGILDILQTLERPGFRSRSGLQTRVLYKLCALRSPALVALFLHRVPNYRPTDAGVGAQCLTYVMTGTRQTSGQADDRAAAAICTELIGALPADAFPADSIDLLCNELMAWHLHRTAAVLVALPQTPRALQDRFCRTLPTGHPVAVAACSAVARAPPGNGGRWAAARLRHMIGNHITRT